jgi:hypothetical protein
MAYKLKFFYKNKLRSKYANILARTDCNKTYIKKSPRKYIEVEKSAKMHYNERCLL